MTLAVIENREPRKSITVDMAARHSMEAVAFEATLRATVFPGNGTREQFAAFLMVARQYDLNPVTKEIYAFPGKGGVVPIVSIDGWIKLINSHPQMDGVEFEENADDKGELVSMTCRLWRKDRSKPIVVTEHLSECFRPTDPWKMKHRMLRHKALIQCARVAFGFAGIYDPDEGERIVLAQDARDTRSHSAPVIAPPPPPPQIAAPPPAAPLNDVDEAFTGLRLALKLAKSLDAANAVYEEWMNAETRSPEVLDEGDSILREETAKWWNEGSEP